MTQLALALERKQANLGKVIQNAGFNWQTLARLVVRTMDGKEVTGEDIRLRCLELNIEPHHVNAWGALINMLVREGRLIHTGRWVPMRGEKSNARQTPVYLVRIDP